MLAEIRIDPIDNDSRDLCIMKDNYIPDEEKNRNKF